jgi:DNA-binding MarR family transcriptional regulator
LKTDGLRWGLSESGRSARLVDESDQEILIKLAELLTRASWRLRRNERKELAPFGLTFAQARALRILVAVAAPLRIGDLASKLEIVPRSATNMVDGLEQAGFLVRRMDPGDRRSILVAPTPRGQELIARLAEQRRESAEALFAPLSAEEKSELARLLAPIGAKSS